MENLPGFVESAITGLTQLIKNYGWSAYSAEPGPLHPALPVWTELFDDWLSVSNLTKVQRLRLIRSLLSIRPELITEIQSIVLDVTTPDDEVWDEDVYGNHLRGAMDDLRSRRMPVPFDLAERFALAKRPNAFFAGIAAIAAVPNEEAINRLISIYRRVEWSDQSFVLDAIDILASRLNLKVMPEHLEGNPPI